MDEGAQVDCAPVLWAIFMEAYAAILRRIAERVGFPSVQRTATQPGVRAVYRVTMHYPDGRASDAVTTLVRFDVAGVMLATVYQGRFKNQPLTRQIDLTDYETFLQEFRLVQFDNLSDQTNIPLYGADLCLIERGAGGFVKGVIVSPQTADQPPYSTLLDVVREHLSEAFREIK